MTTEGLTEGPTPLFQVTALPEAGSAHRLTAWVVDE